MLNIFRFICFPVGISNNDVNFKKVVDLVDRKQYPATGALRICKVTLNSLNFELKQNQSNLSPLN